MNEVTLEKMGRLRLYGMQSSFRAILESKTSGQFTWRSLKTGSLKNRLS